MIATEEGGRLVCGRSTRASQTWCMPGMKRGKRTVNERKMEKEIKENEIQRERDGRMWCGEVTVCPLKGGRGEKMREGEAAVSA